MGNFVPKNNSGAVTPERGPGLAALWSCVLQRTGTGLGGIHDIGQARVDRVRSARESCKSVETSCDDLELAKRINAHVPVPAKKYAGCG